MNDLKIKRRNFQDNVEFLHKQVIDAGDSISQSFLKHELVQMELLGVMSKHNAFKNLGGLQMQGGTSLRLLHGSPRLSGDIDLCFEPTADPNSYQMRDAEYLLELLQDEFTSRYGMNVTLAKAKKRHLIKPEDDIFVDVYMFQVDTSPDDRSAKRTKLKLEIAGLNAETKESVGIKGNWSILPTSYQNMLVPVETLSEIMADKLKALPSAWCLEKRTEYENGDNPLLDPQFRSRDIWDVNFLLSKGVSFDDDVAGMVIKKVHQYNVQDSFPKKLEDMINNIEKMSDLKLPENLQGTMMTNSVNQHILNGKHLELVTNVKNILVELQDKMYPKYTI